MAWTDGKKRLIYLGDFRGRLWAVDARTGKLDRGFGELGKVDLRTTRRWPTSLSPSFGKRDILQERKRDLDRLVASWSRTVRASDYLSADAEFRAKQALPIGKHTPVAAMARFLYQHTVAQDDNPE